MKRHVVVTQPVIAPKPTVRFWQPSAAMQERYSDLAPVSLLTTVKFHGGNFFIDNPTFDPPPS